MKSCSAHCQSFGPKYSLTLSPLKVCLLCVQFESQSPNQKRGLNEHEYSKVRIWQLGRVWLGRLQARTLVRWIIALPQSRTMQEETELAIE